MLHEERPDFRGGRTEEILALHPNDPRSGGLRTQSAIVKDYCNSMARYNSWANRRLYDAASALSRQDYFADKGAFFKSVHGTLNHLLVADRIWMARFTKTEPPVTRLDAILFSELTDLRRAREAEDAKIIAYVGRLGDADLTTVMTYRRASTPENYIQEVKLALVHFFNHQTHHRGQVHAILTTLVGYAPELDHLFFQRASG